jgi:hypothetical protein
MPLVLYATPGLVPAIFLHIFTRLCFIHPLGDHLKFAPSYVPTNENGWPEKRWFLLFFLEIGSKTLLTLLTTVVYAPLDVIITRLAIQRNYGGLPFEASENAGEGESQETTLASQGEILVPIGEDSQFNSVEAIPIDEKAVEKQGEIQAPVIQDATPKEEVVVRCVFFSHSNIVLYMMFSSRLRSPDDEYLGLLDCFQRIRKEEGYGVLYRMAWLTFLGDLLTVFKW